MKTALKIKGRRIPCRVHGCDKGPFKSPQAELMHFHRAHSGRILVGKQKFKPIIAQTNGHHDKVDLGSGRRTGQTAALIAPPVRRKYRKRQKLAKTRTVEIEFDFCPVCLTNLHQLAMGMVLANVKKTVNGCPKCGLDLRAVAAGMVLSSPPKE